MKIKGKILLKEGLSKTMIDELVYIAQESISIYNDGLYLNISNVFFREEADPFIIPIKRVGPGEGDFEIDMENAQAIHIIAIDKPQKKYGWIGPFPFEFEYYTKERFWNRLNCVNLLNILYQSKIDGKDEDLPVIDMIRKKKFAIVVAFFDEKKLNEENNVTKKYLSDLIGNLEQMKEEENYSDFEMSAQELLIDKTKDDVFVLNERLKKIKIEKESVLFEKLTLIEHINALAAMDLSAQDADYALAARHKRRIDELQKN